MLNSIPTAGSEQRAIKKAKGHMLSENSETKYLMTAD